MPFPRTPATFALPLGPGDFPILRDPSQTNSYFVQTCSISRAATVFESSNQSWFQQGGFEGTSFQQSPVCCLKQPLPVERTVCLTSTMLSATAVLAIGLAIVYVARSVRTYLSLKQFGGHWSVGWSRIWLLRTQGSGYMNKTFTEINDTYGKATPPTLPGAVFVKFAYLWCGLHEMLERAGGHPPTSHLSRGNVPRNSIHSLTWRLHYDHCWWRSSN